MSAGYIHSVKVPRLYKTAANIVKNVVENGGSLKSLIYQKNHPNVSGIFALSTNTLQKGHLLELLLDKTAILFKETRLDPWLARVLITELLWGKGYLRSNSKPIQTILLYETQIRALLKQFDESDSSLPNETKVTKPRYVRININQLSVEDGIRKFVNEGWTLLQTPRNYAEYLKVLSKLHTNNFIQDFHIQELFAFPARVSFHNHESYIKGELILQDKASCLSAYLLNPKPGSTVLDMCAAPGMKTSHLAAIMHNQGRIVAVEIDEDRCKTLYEQLALTRSDCVTVLNKDALTLDSRKYCDVEYILVDPSCSGSGIVDRPQLIDSKQEKNPARLKSLQAFQVLLLRHALLNFPSVKRVVYSTCSIHPEENENVVDEILCKVGKAYNLLCAKELLEGQWINTSSAPSLCEDKCLRAVPYVDYSNGFFIAVFERNFNASLPKYKCRNSIEGDIVVKKRIRKRRGKKRKIFYNEIDIMNNEEGEGKEKYQRMGISRCLDM